MSTFTARCRELCQRRWLSMGLMAMALVCFTLALGSSVPAQTKKADDAKKDDAKKTDKKGDAKKDDAKKDDPEAKETPIKIGKAFDVVATKFGGIEQINLINDAVEKFWIDNKIQPSDRCTDYEFVRRAFLDIVGRIPTITEINEFLKDSPQQRRSLLVDRLLEDKRYAREYADNFATIWSVMLLTRSGSGKMYQEQMREWLAEEFLGPKKSGSDQTENPDWAKTATRIITAGGETNRNGAVNYVLHHLGEEIKENAAVTGKWDCVPVTSRTTRLFLGIRTQCVQCHDHPFNGEWGQHHFWGINAFFRQVDTNGRPGMMGKKKKDVTGQQFEVKDNTLFNEKGLVPYERRNGVLLYTDATFLDGKKIPKGFTGNRRELLAKYITKSPYFAKAAVNRMWGHFMGKSFTKDAVDDFGDHNPVSHPELLDQLAEDWATKYQHNPKALIRWICHNRAYGLSAVANKTNDKPEDETSFSRMLLKPMTPEQLFESLMTATQAKLAESKQLKLEAKEAWLDKLIVNFGNDEGEEGSFNGTVVQALLLMNGQDINNAINDPKDGTVANVLSQHSKQGANGALTALGKLYLAALSRPPTNDEIKMLTSPKTYAFRPKSAVQPSSPQFWDAYYQDIFWALLNSNEFILNH